MNAILEQINSAGYVFVEFAVPMLVQSSVLIVVLLLADLLLRKRVRAVFRYWLWMLVLLKLILPTTLSSPVSLGSWFGDELATVKLSETSTSAEPVNSPQMAQARPTEEVSTSPAVTPSAVTLMADSEPAVAEAAASPVVSPTPVTWQGIVFLVWATVVAAMGLLLLQRVIFVCGLVTQAKNPTKLINDTFRFCCGQMGLKGKVGLKVSANAASPAVCGLFRPIILLPQNLAPTLGSSRLRPVLLHELAHIRRGDLWVNLVQTILQIIYFYNPLFWLANSIIRRIREQAVDEAVQVAMGANAPQYPQTLVDVAKMAFNRPALSLRLIGVVESKSQLKVRVKRMLNRPIPKTAKLGILGLIAVLVFAAVLLPMAKAAKEKSDASNVIGQVSKDSANRITYRLDDEVILRICGISSYPLMKDSQWWAADGMVLEKTPISETDRTRLDESNFAKDEDRRKFVVVCETESPKKTTVSFSAKSLSGPKIYVPYATSSQSRIFVMDVANETIDDKAVAITAKVADGKWETVEKLNVGGDTGTASGGRVYTIGDLGWDKTLVTLSYKEPLSPPNVENRIVAVDRSGSIHICYNCSSACAGSGLSTQRLAYNLARNKIDHLEIQHRPYRMFAFRNISLEPSQKTDVRVEVEEASKAGIGTIDVAVEDFRIKPYPAGGLYTVTVAIRNKGSQEAPSFRLNFYQGDPANNLNLHGKPQTGSHGAGPIKSGNVWNESSSPFALKEGLNEILVVLDMDERVAESDEANNRASMKVVVKDGRIIEKSVSYSTQPEVAGSAPKTDVQLEIGRASKVSNKDKMASENLAAEGWALWRQRKLADAEKVFKKAVQKDATNANAWNGLGWAQQNQGKPLNAKASFEKCLQIQPKHAAALNGLGWIAKAQGNTDEAIGYWEKAIKAAPTATAALNGLATTYMELKQFDKAEKYYKMWLKVEPDNTDAKVGLEKAKSEKTDVQVNVEGSAASLQDLIDSAQPGSTVSIPEGVYTEPVEVTKPIVLKGQSRADCVFEVTANRPAIFIDTKGKGRVTIEDLTIKWQLATSDKNIEYPFALGVKDTKAEVKNCYFQPLGNFKRSPVAVRAVGFSNLTIDGCRFEGFEYVICYGEGTKGMVQDSLIEDCGHQGIINYSGSTLRVERNVITGSRYHAVRSTGGTLFMKDNLIINNANRGIYLGNKSARGSITNNIIMGNGTGISGFAQSKVKIENNLILDSSYAGIGMRNSCGLVIRNNIFQGNERGWILFKEGGKGGNTVYRNTFWQNKVDAENFRKTANSITSEPHFADPENGDFSLKPGPALEHKQGLTNPQVLKTLWKIWQNRANKNEPFIGTGQTNLQPLVEAKEPKIKGRRSLTRTKPPPEQNQLNEAVYKQLDEIVELSELNPEMPFSEAIEVLKNSVDPPLKMFVNWRDLYDNADVDQATPINMDMMPAVRLSLALKLLLKAVSGDFAELDYVVEDGIIFIATIESLPTRFETSVYDISDLVSSAADADDIARLVINTVEPDSWEHNGGGGTLTTYNDKKLIVYQTHEIHRQIQDVLQNLQVSSHEQGKSKTEMQ